MSSIDPQKVRRDFNRWLATPANGGYTGMSRLLGGKPSDEALRQFAKGEREVPRYLPRLAHILAGGTAETSAAEDAAEALRLIRAGADLLARAVEQIQRLPIPDDDQFAIDAADKPIPSVQSQTQVRQKKADGGR